jgi:hypothetical protein
MRWRDRLIRSTRRLRWRSRRRIYFFYWGWRLLGLFIRRVCFPLLRLFIATFSTRWRIHRWRDRHWLTNRNLRGFRCGFLTRRLILPILRRGGSLIRRYLLIRGRLLVTGRLRAIRRV